MIMSLSSAGSCTAIHFVRAINREFNQEYYERSKNNVFRT